MHERYLTSYEALCAGLTALDQQAIDASIYLLEHAHYQSRSQIVTFVGDLAAETTHPIVYAWLHASWTAQHAAWWVLAYIERLYPPKADQLRDTIDPLAQIHPDLHAHVGTQVAAWLYAWLTHARAPVQTLPNPVTQTLTSWLRAEHPERALSSLQALLALGADISRTDAARAVAHAIDANIEEADLLGMQCGFIESAERLATQVLQGGPWADIAVQAFVQILPEEAEKRFDAVNLPRRGAPRDRDIQVATIRAAHGDESASKWLANACKTKDLRRRSIAWSGRVRAVSRNLDIQKQHALGKLLLREPESVRAWVISTLDPSCPTQRAWLEQARDYGTEEEKTAVKDALRSALSHRPLVPQMGQRNL